MGNSASTTTRRRRDQEPSDKGFRIRRIDSTLSGTSCSSTDSSESQEVLSELIAKERNVINECLMEYMKQIKDCDGTQAMLDIARKDRLALGVAHEQDYRRLIESMQEQNLLTRKQGEYILGSEEGASKVSSFFRYGK
ncbi:hypothetical protein HDU98_012249 [Podochytrium sp. JEL0797]|nr:hypothetical protein HDU98_012249 [Podochytrium sp. JEL0797]